MQRIEAMRIFVRVTELESFTRAADSLGLPKASVSVAVQQLEAELGARLLHRTTRRVELTQEGRAFYERAKDLLDDMDELQSMFQQGAALRGRLRVDMSSGIAQHFVIPHLPAFLDAHPQIELELSSTDRRVDLVREGFDCVVRVGTLSDSSLVARSLGQHDMMNCASPAYLRRYGTPKRLADLAKHKLVHYVSTLGTKSLGFEYPDGNEGYAFLPMAGQVTVNNSDAYLAACLAGLGIIQVPRAGMPALIKSGQIVEVLPRLNAEPMPINIIYPHRRHLPRRVQVFMNWLDKILRQHLLACAM